MSDERIPPGRIVVPVLRPEAWYDPRIVDASSEIIYTNQPLLNNAIVQIAPANTMRYWFGVSMGTGFATLKFAPWPDPDIFTFKELNGQNLFYSFSLFDYGPLVCQRWYIAGAPGLSIRTIQIMRRGK